MTSSGEGLAVGVIAAFTLLILLVVCAVTHEWLFLVATFPTSLAFFYSYSITSSPGNALITATVVLFVSLYALSILAIAF